MLLARELDAHAAPAAGEIGVKHCKVMPTYVELDL